VHKRTAEAHWQGNLRDGKGTMRLGSGAFEGEYSFASRMENGPGTNPEELIGAILPTEAFRELVRSRITFAALGIVCLLLSIPFVAFGIGSSAGLFIVAGVLFAVGLGWLLAAIQSPRA
jgi:hypothetical protein